MNKERCFELISSLKKSELLALLSDAFDTMNTRQRDKVFHSIERQSENLPIKPEVALNAAKVFLEDSLNHVYYAPFDVNSKNFMDTPEETDAWFSKLQEVFASAMQLTKQGYFHVAIEIFEIAHQLVEAMESGSEIIFADELGMWMFGADEKPYERAYLEAIFAVETENRFVEVAIMLARKDSSRSFFNKTYKTIASVADKQRKSLFDRKAERLSVELESSH